MKKKSFRLFSHYQLILNQFQWKYAIALLAIALLSLCCQLLTQNYLSNQYSDAHLINYAAKLRSDSQTMIKYALLMEQDKNFRVNSKDFSNTYKQWLATHKSLRYGNDFLNIPENGNEKIEELFAIIDSPYRRMIEAGEEICLLIKEKGQAGLPDMQPHLAQLLEYEKTYLLGMEMIVFEYDLISREKIQSLKQLEWWLFSLLVVCLLLEAFLIFLPLHKRFSQTFNELLESNKAARELSSRLQKIRSDAMLMGESKERKRISSEIHDGIGQMLTSLKMRVEMLEEQEAIPKEALTEIREMTAGIVKETRRICSELLPSILDDFGLKSAVYELCKTIRETTHSKVELCDELEEGVLTKQQEVILYRILQEAVNNVVKHAHASLLRLEMELDAENVYVRVIDNGCGFHAKLDNMYKGETTPLYGLGLVNMKERTEALGGRFKLDSVVGKGTIIELSIPIEVE